MGMADNKVSKVNGLAKSHISLQGTLETHYQIEHHGRGSEAQGRVRRNQSGASLGQQQVAHHDNYNKAQQKGRQYGG